MNGWVAVFSALLGLVVLAVGLLDILVTILLPEAQSIVSERLQRIDLAGDGKRIARFVATSTAQYFNVDAACLYRWPALVLDMYFDRRFCPHLRP